MKKQFLFLLIFLSPLYPLMSKKPAQLTSNTPTPKLHHDTNQNYGHGELQGRRPTMEDAYNVQCGHNICLYGLYDGHGGDIISQHIASNLNTIILQKIKNHTNKEKALFQGYIQADQTLKDLPLYSSYNQGTTAITALIDENTIIIANVGDSRAVLSSKGKAIPLSKDHKPDRPDERKRIEKLGGKVITHGVPRVQGKLAISRVLGDHSLSPYVIPNPEIKKHKRSLDDQFLILACDGVWDVFSNEEAVVIVENALKNGAEIQDVPQILVQAAYDAGSTDNISAIVINVKKS